MAISMLTAYQATSVWMSPDMCAGLLLTESIAIEDLVDPAISSPPIWDLNFGKLTSTELRDFLIHTQGGPREIARRIFRLVSDHRLRALSAASAEPITVPGAPIFTDVPEDSGHFPGSYYRHILQGLRAERPA